MKYTYVYKWTHMKHICALNLLKLAGIYISIGLISNFEKKKEAKEQDLFQISEVYVFSFSWPFQEWSFRKNSAAL